METLVTFSDYFSGSTVPIRSGKMAHPEVPEGDHTALLSRKNFHQQSTLSTSPSPPALS